MKVTGALLFIIFMVLMAFIVIVKFPGELVIFVVGGLIVFGLIRLSGVPL